MNKREKVKIVILAGGNGKRMKDPLPKVLTLIKGRPMIKHILESARKSGVDEKPIIVVGYGRELVKKELGDKYIYAVQEKQLGTGHAVLSAEKNIKNFKGTLVLYGDNPYITPETIRKLAEKHLASKNKVTMTTVKLDNFDDWRAFFYSNFSRIVRNGNGKILKSVEFKDANEKEREIREINPCYFCFDTKWLLKKLKTLKNDNSQKEYYLTDLIKFAIQDKENLESMEINPEEALAANSKEELEILEKFEV